MNNEPFPVFGPPLHSRSVVHPFEQKASHHGEEDPNHTEERRLEPQDGHDQRVQSPDELAHFEVERLDHPDSISKLKILEHRKMSLSF